LAKEIGVPAVKANEVVQRVSEQAPRFRVRVHEFAVRRKPIEQVVKTIKASAQQQKARFQGKNCSIAGLNTWLVSNSMFIRSFSGARKPSNASL